MSIIYRSEKGAPLTIEEMDNNFCELEQRLEALEKAFRKSEGIADVQVEGDQMTLIGDHGSKFGPVQLPVVAYVPRGKWQPDTDYASHDVVSHEGSAYVCKSPHRSEGFEREKYWQLLLQGNFSKAQKSTETLSLRAYESGTLPKQATLGQLGVYIDDASQPSLIYGDGHNWRYVTTNLTI
ncbi:MAG: carbohydrate-binding protein [Pseudomonadota bacterium]